jgi:hypothetical protein
MPPFNVSLPLRPFSLSWPLPPFRTLMPLLPVRVSLWTDPVRFSTLEIVSRPALTVFCWAVVSRLTVTAAVAPE